MSDVIALPTAACTPVAQPPRRGRLPSQVIRIERGTYLRHLRNEARNEEAYQRGREDGRRLAERESRQRQDLSQDIAWLKEAAESGHLRSLVYAADVLGDDALHLAAVGKVEDDLNHALAMAARLQHRIASLVEQQESPDDA